MYNNSIIVTQSGYYGLQDFDSLLYVKVIQIFIFVLFSVCILVTDSYIIRVIARKKNLQTTANVLICILLLIDTLPAVYFTVTSTVILIKGEIWLTDVSARILAFVNGSVRCTQYVTTLLVSVEKFAYCAHPYKHERWFTARKTFVYFVVSVIFSLVANGGMYLGYPARFFPSLLQCIDANIEEPYNDYVLPVYKISFSMRLVLQIGSFLGTMSFQVCILISAILSRRKLKIQTYFLHNLEKRLWRRKFTNAFSLFSVIVVHVIGWLWMALAIEKNNFSMHPAIQRTGVIFHVFISAMINPIAILLGNKPLREAVLNKNVKPAWLVELPLVESRQNIPDQEQTAINTGILHSNQTNTEDDKSHWVSSSVVQSNFMSMPNLHHALELTTQRRPYSTSDLHTERNKEVHAQNKIKEPKGDGHGKDMFPETKMDETQSNAVESTDA